jgi:hypothetical protein
MYISDLKQHRRSKRSQRMIESQNGEVLTGSTGLLSWQLEYQADQNALLIRTSGPIDKTSFPAMLTAAFGAAERHQTTRILADHSKSLLKLNPLEIYYAPRVIMSCGAHSDYILALVFGAMTEDIQFLENVCRNSGLTVAVFTDNSAAFQWLSDSAKQVVSHCKT